MKALAFALVWAAALLAGQSAVAQDDPVAEAVLDYMDFATMTQGIILPEQIDRTVFEAATFVDVRGPGEYAAEQIPGAINIGWRELPRRLGELPASGPVIVYCDTGMRSSQAMFAARLLGHENVLVIGTGLQGWKARAAYTP